MGKGGGLDSATLSEDPRLAVGWSWTLWKSNRKNMFNNKVKTKTEDKK